MSWTVRPNGCIRLVAIIYGIRLPADHVLRKQSRPGPDYLQSCLTSNHIPPQSFLECIESHALPRAIDGLLSTSRRRVRKSIIQRPQGKGTSAGRVQAADQRERERVDSLAPPPPMRSQIGAQVEDQLVLRKRRQAYSNPVGQCSAGRKRDGRGGEECRACVRACIGRNQEPANPQIGAFVTRNAPKTTALLIRRGTAR